MKRLSLTCGAVLFFALFLGSVAWGDLCAKCADKPYIRSIGKCVECGGMTASGAHKLCAACSKKLGQCEHCRGPLKAAEKPAPKNLLPGSDLSIEQAKDGIFGMIAVCEAVKDAVVEQTAPLSHAMQDFKIVKILAGKTPTGAQAGGLTIKGDKPVELSYRIMDENGERAIKKGERIIWILQEPNEDEWAATKAFADTPENRKALTAPPAKEPKQPGKPPAPEKPGK